MPDETEPKQRPAHLFQPGQSGNPKGRPKGSRSKLGEAFIEALYQDFEVNGVAVIETVRVDRPHEYLKVVASLLPKEMKLTTDSSDLTDEQLDQRIRQLASAISLELGGEERTAGTTGRARKKEGKGGVREKPSGLH